MITVDFVGERELELTFRGIKAAASDGCRRAVRIGIEEAVAQAKQEHTFKNQSGDLERSIGGQVTTETFGGSEGVVYAGADYASFVEDDTKAHVIRPKAGRRDMGPLPESQGRRKRGEGARRALLAWEGAGGAGDWHFAREVHHPGTKGQPFMGPAQQKCERVAIREIEASALDAQAVIDS